MSHLMYDFSNPTIINKLNAKKKQILIKNIIQTSTRIKNHWNFCWRSYQNDKKNRISWQKGQIDESIDTITSIVTCYKCYLLLMLMLLDIRYLKCVFINQYNKQTFNIKNDESSNQFPSKYMNIIIAKAKKNWRNQNTCSKWIQIYEKSTALNST